MSILIAGNLTVEDLVDDDSRDNNRKADPPVTTKPAAESLGHAWTIRPPGDLPRERTDRGSGTLLAILAGAGLRIGECLGLRWQNVDLGTGTLYVTDCSNSKRGSRNSPDSRAPRGAGGLAGGCQAHRSN